MIPKKPLSALILLLASVILFPQECAILSGTFATPPPNSPTAGILMKIPATSGATIGQVTFGIPQSGIAKIVLSKTYTPSFMVTSSGLCTLEKSFYELNATIKVFNESGELVGMARLRLVVDGSRNPTRDNNIVTLNAKLQRGTYNVVITIFYWTGTITEKMAGTFTIQTIVEG
jgi:hypothetical protein